MSTWSPFFALVGGITVGAYPLKCLYRTTFFQVEKPESANPPCRDGEELLVVRDEQRSRTIIDGLNGPMRDHLNQRLAEKECDGKPQSNDNTDFHRENHYSS